MANLKPKYMGLELKNPIIIGTSNLVTSVDSLKKIERAGAAAVVYKSLFEEQIHLENLELFEQRTDYEERNAEMITLFPNSKSVPLFNTWQQRRLHFSLGLFNAVLLFGGELFCNNIRHIL